MSSVRTVASVLGLPLTDWRPDGIPAPAQPLDFTLDAAGKDLQAVLSEALLYTYDILADDRALRADPAAFERLRGDYPIRREPAAFTLRLRGGSAEMAARLSELGFQVIID